MKRIIVLAAVLVTGMALGWGKKQCVVRKWSKGSKTEVLFDEQTSKSDCVKKAIALDDLRDSGLLSPDPLVTGHFGDPRGDNEIVYRTGS